MTALVQIEDIAPNAALLRLNRPEKRNALNRQMVGEAISAIEQLEAQHIEVAILTGAGATFCGGADLNEDFHVLPGQPSPADLPDRLLSSSIFWIAGVNGPAVGIGVSLIAVCPLSIVHPNAWFGLPEMGFGVFPSTALAYLEPRLGTQLTLEWALLNRRYQASAPELRPLVSVLSEGESYENDLVDRAHALAQTPAAVRSARLAWRGRYCGDDFERRRVEMAELLNGQLRPSPADI